MSRIDRVAAILIVAALLPLYAQSTKSAATITVISSANPAVYAARLIFTVAVAGSPVPGGTVSATLAGNPVASATLDDTGRAVIAVPQMPGAGSNAITFAYSGDARYAPAQLAYTQFLTKANTHTAAVIDRNLRLTATVRIDELTVGGTSMGGAA